MTVLGLSFTKLHGERGPIMKGKGLSIKNNIGITDAKKAEIDLEKAKQNGITFTFHFLTEYTSLGRIEIEGTLLYMGEKKVIDDALKLWKDKKKLSTEITRAIMPNILNKCNIQALVMSRDLNLPSPIPLPRLNMQEPAKK